MNKLLLILLMTLLVMPVAFAALVSAVKLEPSASNRQIAIITKTAIKTSARTAPNAFDN